MHVAHTSARAQPRGNPTRNNMLFRTDRLFAEAAQSRERCDRLLKGYARGRLVLFIFVIVFGALALAGLCHEASQLRHFLDAISNSGLGDKPPDVPKLSPLAPFTLVLLFVFILEFIFVLHADACVKLLMIVRQQHDSVRSSGASGAS